MDKEIKKLWERNKELREMIIEDRRERAFDRKRIKKLEDLNTAKRDNKRRDWDVLRRELKEEVQKERYGMDYKAVMKFSHFRSHIEAYRLMDSTVEKYPLEVKIHNQWGSAKGKRVIVACEV